MQQQIAKGDVLQRLAGVSFIVGAIVTGVFNILHPRISDPTDMQAFIQGVADNNGGFWEVDHLLLAVGVWALMIGIVGVYRSISTGGAAAWARLGFYGAVVGTTLWTALFALMGLGLSEVVEQWEKAAGADKATLFLVASSLARFEGGLSSMSVIVYWLAFVFLGIGMVLSTVYPKWVGWPIIILGVLTVAAVGIPVALAGISQTLEILFVILSMLTLVWALVLGVWITRKAW
ncbi:MAG: hypothetical protein ACE5I2_16315 [Anaerolineae bacterium]